MISQKTQKQRRNIRGLRTHFTFHPRGLKRREGGHTSGCGLRDPEQQFLLPPSELRISVEGSLPLSGITPSKRLNIQLSKIDTASCLPLGAQLESTRPRKVPGHTVSDSRIASGWMGVNELLSNCCRFAVTFYLMVNKSSNW